MRTKSARNSVAATRPTSPSRITNRTRLLENVDGRSSSARRFRDLVRAYEAELGGDLSEAERSLVRQAVALQLQAERMQAPIVRGELVDSDALIMVSRTSKRLRSIIASKTGKRKPATSPTLADYLAAKQAQQVADVSEAAEE
jgi:hypothetical protein